MKRLFSKLMDVSDDKMIGMQCSKKRLSILCSNRQWSTETNQPPIFTGAESTSLLHGHTKGICQHS